MRAAEREVISMSAPVTISSSLVAALFSHFTPDSMFTVRTIFSPRKLRISTVPPLLVIVTLIGKCAYTRRSLYWNLCSTPVKRFAMWLQQLLSMDSCFDLAKYILARTFLLQLASRNSTGRCLKLRLRVPCLPVTSTTLDLTEILMPFGTFKTSSCINVFIALSQGSRAGGGACAWGISRLE